MRSILVALALVLSLPAAAQTPVSQASGARNVIPWYVQGSTSTAATPLNVNGAALVAGKTTEVAVTNSAGGTTVPATALTSRRAVELQNNGPNTIYCTVDGTAPVVTTNGRWIAANGGTWSLDIGPLIIVKCIAATAAQVTTAATMVTELR